MNLRGNRKRIVLMLLVLGLVLPAAMVFMPAGVSSRLGAFAEEDFQREQALSAALQQTVKAASSRFSFPLTEGTAGERYIVRFSETLPEKELLALLSEIPHRLLAQSSERIFSVTLEDPDEFRSVCGDALLYCSEDRVLHTSAIPTDPLIAERTEYAQLDLFSAWERVEPSSGILVAVLDTGIDRTHEDLSESAILDGYDVLTGSAGVSEDLDGHGTAVTGLIAATAENGVGSAGVAYGVRILPVRVAKGSKDIYSSDMISGIRFAADAGARILNLSLGGYTYSAAEYDAVRYALNRGCIVIAAAGNDGETDRAEQSVYPASYPGVISIGSCDASGARSAFSQQNTEVDLLAPGENLLLLVAGGEGEAAYREGNGTSFSAALMTGVAALALSALDDGVRMTADELLVLLANGRTRRSGVGYGAVSALQAVENANLPLITGVQNGKTYSKRVTVKFNRGTATLDGEDFFDGDVVYRAGGHTLVVTDGENRQTVSFRILYTPASYEMTEGDEAVTFTYTGGTATVDGFPYQSGDPIVSPGWHVFRLTDAVGDVTERSFFCDYRLPFVAGVEEGGVYRQPVRIRVSGKGKATLDGEEIGKEVTVFADGEHTLTVSNAEESRTLHFTLETGVQAFENTVARSGVICDEANGWYAVYSEMLIGLRVFDLETGEFLTFFDTETVRGYAFAEDRLLIFGEWCLTVLDPARMDSEEALLAAYSIRCEGFAYVNDRLYCLSDGMVYTVSPEEGGWSTPSKNFSLVPLFETDAEELYTDGTSLWLYSIGANRFDRYDRGELTSYFAPFDAAGERKYLMDGWLFCAGYAIRTADDSVAFTFDGYAVGSTDSLLFTTDAVYRLSDGIRIGSYENAVSCVLSGEESVFICSTAGGILRYPRSSGYGYATDIGSLFAGTAQSDAYTTLYNLYVQASATDSAAIGNRFGAVFGAERSLLLFRNGALEREVALPFTPAGICLMENHTAVWSADGVLLWMDGQLYRPGGSLQDAFFFENALHALIDGELFRLDGEDWTDLSIAANAASGADDVLVWHSGGVLYVRSGDHTAQTSCEASGLYTDGTYILADRTVYRVSDLTVVARLEADVLDFCEQTVLTTEGLYAIDARSYLSDMELGAVSSYNACLGKGTGVVLFEAGTISVSGYDHPVWEEPVVSGVDANMRYDAETTIQFDRGYGYLDGVPCSTDFTVTEAGTHVFTLVLPCAVIRSYSFTVIPALESIAFSSPVYRLSVGESGTLHIRYFPEGATMVPVVFSVDNDCILLEENGDFVAMYDGMATVTAQTEDGRLFTACYVSVRAELLRFSSESGYRVDRENGLLYGIPAGTKAEDLLSYALSEGEIQVSTEIVGTGTEILLLSGEGEELDRLTAVVEGDLDGDGYVTLWDLLLLEEALERGGEMESMILAAADLSGSGSVSDQDANLLERMLLRGEGNANLGTPPAGKTGTVGLFLPSTVYAGDTLYLTIYLKDSERASCVGCAGASGQLVYDASAMSYLGAETYGWNVSVHDAGGRLSYLASGESSTGTLPVVTLRFAVDTEALEQELTLLLRNGVLLYKNRAYGISREEIVFTPEERVYGNIDLWIDGMTSPFSEEKTKYQVSLPIGTPALDYTLCYPKGTTVTVQNTVFDGADELDATFTFRLPGGEKRTYTIHARRDGAPPPGSDSRLASLTVENVAFPFSPYITFYELTVPYKTERLSLQWETMDEDATAICTDPLLLPDRETDVTVTVTAPDGSETVYTLRVHRLAKEDPSDSTSVPAEQPEPPTENDPVWMWFLLAAVLLSFIGGAAVFLIRTRKG